MCISWPIELDSNERHQKARNSPSAYIHWANMVTLHHSSTAAYVVTMQTQWTSNRTTLPQTPHHTTPRTTHHTPHTTHHTPHTRLSYLSSFSSLYSLSLPFFLWCGAGRAAVRISRVPPKAEIAGSHICLIACTRNGGSLRESSRCCQTLYCFGSLLFLHSILHILFLSLPFRGAALGARPLRKHSAVTSNTYYTPPLSIGPRGPGYLSNACRFFRSDANP